MFTGGEFVTRFSVPKRKLTQNAGAISFRNKCDQNVNKQTKKKSKTPYPRSHFFCIAGARCGENRHSRKQNENERKERNRKEREEQVLFLFVFSSFFMSLLETGRGTAYTEQRGHRRLGGT